MSTERRLRIYDHRLVRLVQETGDGRIATGMGVPRSTVAGWLKPAPRAITSEPGLDDASEIELRVRIATLEWRGPSRPYQASSSRCFVCSNPTSSAFAFRMPATRRDGFEPLIARGTSWDFAAS